MEKIDILHPKTKEEEYFALQEVKRRAKIIEKVTSEYSQFIINLGIKGADLLMNTNNYFREILRKNSSREETIQKLRETQGIFKNVSYKVNRSLGNQTALIFYNFEKVQPLYENFKNLDSTQYDFLIKREAFDLFGLALVESKVKLDNLRKLKEKSIFMDVTPSKMKEKINESYEVFRKIADRNNYLEIGSKLEKIIQEDPLMAINFLQLSGTLSTRDVGSIFYGASGKVENLYPGSCFNEDSLSDLLEPQNYYFDKENDSLDSKVFLKKGDSRNEMRKLSLKVYLRENHINIKYLNFGLFGRKLDFVAEVNPKEVQVKHLDEGDIEFKTYNNSEIKGFYCGKDLGNSFTNYQIENLFNSDEKTLNPFFYNGTLNYSGIGGVALKKSVDFVKENYFKLRSIRKKNQTLNFPLSNPHSN